MNAGQLQEFAAFPVDYAIALWSGLRERRERDVNDRSLSTARLGCTVEAFLGGKPRIEDYLRYPIANKKKIDTKGVTREAAIALRDDYRAGVLNPWVARAFFANKELFEIIERYWEEEE